MNALTVIFKIHSIAPRLSVIEKNDSDFRFEAFGLVDRHDPHSVGIGGNVDVPVGILGRYPGKPEKRFEAVFTLFFEVFYHLENLDQGGFLRGNDVEKVESFVNLRDEIINGKITDNRVELIEERSPDLRIGFPATRVEWMVDPMLPADGEEKIKKLVSIRRR